jgi:hypothetical protein
MLCFEGVGGGGGREGKKKSILFVHNRIICGKEINCVG